MTTAVALLVLSIVTYVISWFAEKKSYFLYNLSWVMAGIGIVLLIAALIS